MSQQVKVYGELDFRGKAEIGANIRGNWNPLRAWGVEHFWGIAIDTTNDWNSAGQAAGAVSITAPHHLTITTEANDDDEWAFASGLHFYGQYGAILEVRARNDDVSGLAHNIGFASATSYAGDIAMRYSGTTLTSTAVDFAGFLLDVDATTKNIYGVSVKTNVDGSVRNSAHTETDSSWATYRVELQERLDASGNTVVDAVYYLNTSGKAIDPAADLVGINIDAISPTAPLCIYIACMNREAAANTLDVDYIKWWQDVD